MAERAPQQPVASGTVAVMVAETAESVDEALLPPTARSARAGWLCAFWLNMSVLWAYQSLVSAQNFYIAQYPKADLSFWGTVAVGACMVAGQLVCMLGGLDERLGYDVRVGIAYLGFAAIGVAVLAAPSVGVILCAFGLSGLLNTLSESPLYDLAAIWGEGGRLVGAINLGNGSAGVLNITLDFLIRLGALAAVGGSGGGTGEAEHIAHTLFLSLLIVTSLSCLPVYWYWTRRIGFFRMRILAARRRCAKAGAGYASYARVAKKLRGVALAELSTFLITLSIWPGLPCGAPLGGTWFGANPQWFCSPWVIGVFNYADWVGRWLGTLRNLVCCQISIPGPRTLAASTHTLLPPTQRSWDRDLPPQDRAFGAQRLYTSALSRLLFVPLVAWLSRGSWAAPELLLAVLALVGVSNGLVGTLCFIRAQAMVDETERELGSRIMVLALYSGIAAGSMLAALAFRGGDVDEVGAFNDTASLLSQTQTTASTLAQS